MKRNLFWMLASILICGAIVTSCSKDDDNDDSQPTETEAKTYDVTLTFMTYKTISAYIDCEFTYTDHNGKKSAPVMITGKENGEGLTVDELKYYKTIYPFKLSQTYPESLFLEYVASHYTIKDVPADAQISWETIQHTAQGATAPTAAFSYVRPCVMVTMKANNGLVKNDLNLTEFAVSATKLNEWFENIVKKRDGQKLSSASGSVKPGAHM